MTTKKNFSFILFTFLMLEINAQSAENVMITARDTAKHKVYTIVEQMPEFPGGEAALLHFITQTCEFPRINIDSNFQRKLTVSFVIYEDGSINEVVLRKSSGYKMIDDEAVRVISAMPNWKPGRQQAKNVRVQYVLPIVFRLN